MAGRIQKTAESLHLKMLHKYGTEAPHKHNKYHLKYRFHQKSHPINPNKKYEFDSEHPQPLGLLKKENLKKLRKRLDKRSIH